MKKLIAILLVVVVVIVTVVVYNYNTYKSEVRQVEKLNQEYENFANGEILGTSLITLINKSIDLNNKNNIQVNQNGMFIENDTNSVRIDVKFLEKDEVVSMESIGNLGSELFSKNYAASYFKCVEKQYHEQTHNIRYMLFEEIQ